jgi:tetratricopeptide (TPR) repeat protein
MEIVKEIGIHARMLHTMNSLGIVASTLGAYEDAHRYFSDSLAMANETGNRRMQANLLCNLGNILMYQRKYSESLNYLHESLALAREIGHYRVLSWGLEKLGSVLMLLNRDIEAEERFQESLYIAKEMGEQWLIADAMTSMGNLDLKHGDLTGAWSHYREALRLAHSIQAVPTMLTVLASIARLIHTQGDSVRAGEIVGLILLQPTLNSEAKETCDLARSELETKLTPDELANALSQGVFLELNEIVSTLLNGKLVI